MNQKPALKIIVITALIIALSPLVLFSATAESKICVVKFSHNFPMMGGLQMSGEAEIDYGTADREKVTYDSMTKLLLELYAKGYELKNVYSYPIGHDTGYTFFIFMKN